jgi:hypothetical protein
MFTTKKILKQELTLMDKKKVQKFGKKLESVTVDLHLQALPWSVK